MPELACRPSWRRIAPTSSCAASLAIAYGVVGRQGVSSHWGLSGASPKIAPEAATKTRIAGSSSRTASRIAAHEPAIAWIVSPGRSQEAGTNDGAARW